MRRIVYERKQKARLVREELRRKAWELEKRLGRATVILYGSYASGSFSKYSDIDVLVISEKFKGKRILERYSLINDILSSPYEPKLYTPEEFCELLENPSWRKALGKAIVIIDAYNIAKTLREAGI